MPRLIFLAAPIVLGPTHSSSALAEELPPIRQVVSFGASFSDAGTYWFRFTTNPGLTFAQHLALHYGQMPFPNQHLDQYQEAFQGRRGDAGLFFNDTATTETYTLSLHDAHRRPPRRAG